MKLIGTVPLYGRYSPGASDHFCETSIDKRDNAVPNLGSKDEKIAGYVHTVAAAGVVPLYRMYSGHATDHFYSTSA